MSALTDAHANQYELDVVGVMPGTQPTPTEPPKQTLRTDFELMAHFVRGNVSVRELFRHPRLNPHDRPILDQHASCLRAILNDYNKTVGPALSTYHRFRMQEMVDIIDAGQVEPAPLVPPTDEMLHSIATNLVRTLRGGRTYDDIYAGLRANPPLSACAAGRSHVIHGGRLYLHEQFPYLPRSAKVYRELQGVVIDYLGRVVALFELHGYCTPDDATAILTLAFAHSPDVTSNKR